MILPETGTVVVIDENYKEALPIIKALSKSGIATTYYYGTENKELPKSGTTSPLFLFSL